VRGEIHDDELMEQTLKRFTPALAVSVVLQALIAGATLAVKSMAKRRQTGMQWER
jgi:hypothetical protein